MERWVEHYCEIYSRVNVVSEEALMAMESLSIMDELGSLEHSSRNYMRYFANAGGR